MRTGSISVRDYLRMIFRRKWCLILPISASILVAGLLTLTPLRELFPAKYRAIAYVLRKDLSVLRSAPASLVSHDVPSIPLEVFQGEILTATILDDVIRKTKQDVGLMTSAQWQEKHAELRRSIRIDALGRGVGQHLIAIEVTHKFPLLARDIANAVADTYMERSLQRRRTHGESAVEFFDEEQQEYLDQLRKVEKELDRYREEHFADLPEVKSGILNQLFSLGIEKSTLERQLTQTRKGLEEVASQLKDIPPTVQAEVTTERNPLATELENQINARKRALASLLARYTEEHPDVEAAQDEIAALQAQLDETPGRLDGTEREAVNPVYQDRQTELFNLKQQFKAHEAALLQVEAQIEATQQELQKVASEEKDYRQLLRQQDEYAALYEQWRDSLTREQMNLMVADREYGRLVEIHTRALKPEIPIRPAGWKMAFACLLGGLVLGIAVMFGFEYCDRSLRDMADAVAFLDVPVLGSIRKIDSPLEAALRRRRLLAAATSLVALIVIGGLGVYLWESIAPGEPARAFQRMQNVLSKLLNRISNYG